MVVKFFKFLFALQRAFVSYFHSPCIFSHIELSRILSFPATSRVVTMLKVTGYRNLFILNENLFYCSYDGKVVQKKVIKPLFKTRRHYFVVYEI
jgi:hypothetical protein